MSVSLFESCGGIRGRVAPSMVEDGGCAHTAKRVETLFAAMMCSKLATTQLRNGEGQWAGMVGYRAMFEM